MARRNVPIDYTSRDFDSIRDDLVNYAKRYYPDTFKDFSEASFGSLMLDTVAYVGDIMSFYLDYQVNESFIDTAVDFRNILRLAKQMGYKYTGAKTTSGMVSFYAIVPATSTGLGPNTRFMPILKSNTTLRSDAGASFILTEDVRFDDPANEIVVANTNASTGAPISFAVKAEGQVISGIFDQTTETVGAFKKFRTVRINNPNLVEIISVFDSEGHEYFEVEYLTQDVIYKAVPNRDENTRQNAPSLIRPFIAARRFVIDRDANGITLTFGHGSDSETTSQTVADPANVVLQRTAKDYTTDVSFDPSNLIGNDKLGIGPANTTLTIRFRENTAENANAALGTINSVAEPVFEFNDPTISNTSPALDVITSIECFNEEPLVGSTTTPTREEVRTEALMAFSSQNRAVTASDYEALTYMMPGKFGSIKRARVVRDQDSLKRNLNIYVISENAFGKLAATNNAIKENLKIHLNRYRMINDTVDILDAKIVNIGIDFEVVSSEEVNKFEVLDSCILALRRKFSTSMFIGERFYITDVYTELNKVRGVVDTSRVKLIGKSGGDYSSSSLNIDQYMSLDGRYLSVPDNVILEIKFPRIDIKGTVR